jgi:hypothetical protein
MERRPTNTTIRAEPEYSSGVTIDNGGIATAYDSVEITLDWYPESGSNEIIYPSSEDMGALFLSLQLFYDEISDGLEIPRTFLQVEQVSHPNMSVSLKGLGEPIKALRDFLAALPNLIVSIWTIPARIREQKAEIEANMERLEILRSIMKAYKKAPEKFKREHLQEILKYAMGKEKITPTLPVAIRPSRRAGAASSSRRARARARADEEAIAAIAEARIRKIKGLLALPRLHLASVPGASEAAQAGGGERCRGAVGDSRLGNAMAKEEGTRAAVCAIPSRRAHG